MPTLTLSHNLIPAAARQLVPALTLLLILWATRLWALDAFPLHVDEGIHIAWAVEVWNGHPFWNISDAKIVSHWPIALFYPQNAPVYAARLPVVLIATLGLAAGWSLLQNVFGARAALLGALLWIACPYMLFFERLALMDAQVGALVALAAWAAYRAARRSARFDAALAGVCVALAPLFKLNAAPTAFTAAAIVLGFSPHPWRIRLRSLVVMGASAALCFVPPLAYIALRGRDLFEIPRTFFGVGGDQAGQASANLARFSALLTGFGGVAWAALLLTGLALLLALRPRQGGLILLAAAPNLLVVLLTSRAEFLRYYAVGVPILLLLAGAGWGLLADRLQPAGARLALTGALAALLLAETAPFALALYRDPDAVPLPDFMRRQYVTEQSAGFGLREAVSALANTTEPGALIVGSMVRDSCRRANYYAPPDRALVCADRLGLDAIGAALKAGGVFYVLSDRPPYNGVDVTALGAYATRVAAYPRPGESETDASVVLWRVEGDDR
ncbi:MAG: glycosyltransferase family 39 protein [Aggregatilineales bacterium]